MTREEILKARSIVVNALVNVANHTVHSAMYAAEQLYPLTKRREVVINGLPYRYNTVMGVFEFKNRVTDTWEPSATLTTDHVRLAWGLLQNPTEHVPG